MWVHMCVDVDVCICVCVDVGVYCVYMYVCMWGAMNIEALSTFYTIYIYFNFLFCVGVYQMWC